MNWSHLLLKYLSIGRDINLCNISYIYYAQDELLSVIIILKIKGIFFSNISYIYYAQDELLQVIIILKIKRYI